MSNELQLLILELRQLLAKTETPLGAVPLDGGEDVPLNRDQPGRYLKSR
jgi:hypothetical protein